MLTPPSVPPSLPASAPASAPASVEEPASDATPPSAAVFPVPPVPPSSGRPLVCPPAPPQATAPTNTVAANQPHVARIGLPAARCGAGSVPACARSGGDGGGHSDSHRMGTPGNLRV